jgi:hypothetical protein
MVRCKAGSTFTRGFDGFAQVRWIIEYIPRVLTVNGRRSNDRDVHTQVASYTQ